MQMCSQTFTDEECPEEWPKDVNPDGSYGPIPCETCPEWRTFTMTYISWDDRPMLLPWTPEYLARLERRRVRVEIKVDIEPAQKFLAEFSVRAKSFQRFVHRALAGEAERVMGEYP